MNSIPKCPAWYAVWQPTQSSTPLLTRVWPPCDHGSMWWASVRFTAIEQPGLMQPRSRAAIARFWPLVKKRRLRPKSKGWLLPPMTSGRIPALQASRRAVAAAR